MGAALMIGGLASLASVASFVPQAWKVIATRNTRSLSAPTYALTTFGFALWLIYGILLGQ
ncbi:SemiSWEET family sugar transporter [Roseococcus sp. YIM B11640]|uniref:SemiSWEET family sugar transporter n=1 Tax=Roseococcus sp. YIM B11640 TaxID=3133973 RepID=UPI003C7EA69D